MLLVKALKHREVQAPEDINEKLYKGTKLTQKRLKI